MSEDTKTQVNIEFDRELTLLDGTVLRANVYRPIADTPLPVLLTRIPYGKDGFYEGSFHQGALDPIRAARRGYIVVVQDVRGTNASDGAFEPFRNEYEDGAATAAWAAALPGSSGSVGMYGGSYFGFTQFAAAYGPSPAVHAIAPRMRCADPYNGMYFRQGAFELCMQVSWYLAMSMPDVFKTLGEEDARARALVGLAADLDRLPSSGYAYRPLAAFLPLRRPDIAGPMSETFFSPLRDPIDLNDLGFLDVTSRLDKVDAPAFHIGGWYDIFIQQTIDDYAAMQARGVECQLLIGPGAHGVVTMNPVGERVFGLGAQDLSIGLSDSAFDMQIRWFDRWLKGQAEKRESQPVKLFVMGEDQWRDFPSWPVPAVATDYHLHGDGTLARDIPSPSKPTAYAYDPDEPVPTRGGAIMADAGHRPGAYDQRGIESREDVLCFTSEPLEEDLTIIGRVTASIWASSDAVDTDFVVRLCDVQPDGCSWNIVDGIVRAQYRDGPAEPQLLEPGRRYRFDIDLWSTANTFRKGNRIRLQVTSSNFPRWDANPNTGTPFSSAEAVVAMQSIFHEPDAPSKVTLPVVLG